MHLNFVILRNQVNKSVAGVLSCGINLSHLNRVGQYCKRTPMNQLPAEVVVESRSASHEELNSHL